MKYFSITGRPGTNADTRCLRLALVGISGYGRIYLQEVEKAVARGEVELAAVCTVNPDGDAGACSRLQARGTRIFSDWMELMEACRGKVDLCLLPVPIHLHEEMTVRALECGMNVLVEKPLTVLSRSYTAIRAAEERSGRWVAVGFQDFYRPTTQAIREDLDANRIGRVRHVAWQGLWPRPMDYFLRNNWAGRLAVEGRPVLDSPLNNAFAHYLTLSFFLAGAGKAAMAAPKAIEAALSRCYPIETFDTGKIIITCDTGVTIRAAVTHCCEREFPVCLTVIGDRGWMRWENHESVSWSDGSQSLIENWQDCITNMFRSVFDRARGRSGPLCTCADAHPQLRFIEMLHSQTEISNRPDWIGCESDGKAFRFIPGIVSEFNRWMGSPAPDANVPAPDAPLAGIPHGATPMSGVATTSSTLS